jgi:iron complex outermembrane receptor protein
MKHHSVSLFIGACLAGAATSTAAIAADQPLQELELVEVSATRLRSVPDIDVPASISTVRVDADSNGNQTNVTEVLAGLPGVTALDRQNYAQDTQLSIRGFGARSTFGVRGLRLYIDGIPASMPDGQGQLSHFNVIGADTVQVLRGPFSALYGNSSGGVVQMWSAPGTSETSARVRATYGSYGTKTLAAQGTGTLGPVDYNLALSRFDIDGYRDHASARRDSANLRLGVDVGEGRKLTFVTNYVDIPSAQDTLGVTPLEWWTDPRTTTAVAEQFNTRKSVEQLQGGMIFEQQLGASTLHATAYVGNRQITQFLGIPPRTQTNPAVASTQLQSGGVVDLDTDYRGLDLRWSWNGNLIGRPVEFTVGGNFDDQNQLRRGYENFIVQGNVPPPDNSCAGVTTCGVLGRLRRDENDKASNFDQYAQAWWQFADQWSVLAGVRHSKVKFHVIDRYVSGLNGNDGGRKSYSDTTLVGGLMFRPTDTLRLYVSTGDGFETPTINELAYRADGQPGMAFGLRPASSHNYEVGAKWRPAGEVELDAALFRADTRDELVVVRNSGGRSSFGNVDRSRRQGLELALRVPVGRDLQFNLDYTWLDAEFRSDFGICAGPPPCNTPNVTVPRGSQVPGVPRHQGQLGLSWTPGAWSIGVNFAATSSIVVADASQFATTTYGTDHAFGYGLWNADVGYRWRFASSDLRGFVSGNNLTDKTYVGSVIVNEGNGRYFEAGPGRSILAGVQWRWH